MITYLKEFSTISLYKKIIYILSLILLTYLSIKSFYYIMDLEYTILCMDNDGHHPNNANNRNNNWLGTVANVAINSGIAYGALRGGLAFSSSLTVAPPHVKLIAFGGAFGIIYSIRRFVDADRINQLVNNANNFGNNHGGNWFNSPLEYGEALQGDSLSLYLGDIINLNLFILILFNILVIILINRVIGYKIIDWLQSKISTNNIIYRIIYGSYRANMKVSTWFIGFIIIFIYIGMFSEIWGLRIVQDILTKLKL